MAGVAGGGGEEFFYPSPDDVVQFHADALDTTTSDARARLGGNEGKLEGALERPRTHAYYSGADIVTQAVVLALAISASQAFIDGNKRTAHVAMHAFLIGNGYESRASQQQYADWILRLAGGESIDLIADELRRSLGPT